jgi:predicted transposase/invertase (TIGR01784 family)
MRLQSGEQVDVEMQSQRRPALRERALYYWARLYTGQLLRGDPYTALRRCVVVLITNFAELAVNDFIQYFKSTSDTAANS